MRYNSGEIEEGFASLSYNNLHHWSELPDETSRLLHHENSKLLRSLFTVLISCKSHHKALWNVLWVVHILSIAQPYARVDADNDDLAVNIQ